MILHVQFCFTSGLILIGLRFRGQYFYKHVVPYNLNQNLFCETWITGTERNNTVLCVKIPAPDNIQLF